MKSNPFKFAAGLFIAFALLLSTNISAQSGKPAKSGNAPKAVSNAAPGKAVNAEPNGRPGTEWSTTLPCVKISPNNKDKASDVTYTITADGGKTKKAVTRKGTLAVKRGAAVPPVCECFPGSNQVKVIYQTKDPKGTKVILEGRPSCGKQNKPYNSKNR